MRSKVTTAAGVAGLLVIGALVSTAVSTPTVAFAQEESAVVESYPEHRGHGLLQEVLAGLVEDGTLTADQVEAINSALEIKAEEIREMRQEQREMMKEFAEDGVFTADELEQLGPDHPFNDPDGPFAEAAADGELTVDEIRDIQPHPRRAWFKRGARLGALLDDGGIDAEEYEGLSDDHPLKQIDVSEYLEDGLITIDELREIRSELKDDSAA